MLYYYCKARLLGRIVYLQLSGNQETMREFLKSKGIIETFVSYNNYLDGFND